MYILDSDWVIQALARREPASSVITLLAGAQKYVSIVTLGEIYEGAFSSSNPQLAMRGFQSMLGSMRVLNLNDAIMELFAELRARLRRQGLGIADMDLLIAATALHYNLTLLTFNRSHFARIPDLRFYQP